MIRACLYLVLLSYYMAEILSIRRKLYSINQSTYLIFFIKTILYTSISYVINEIYQIGHYCRYCLTFHFPLKKKPPNVQGLKQCFINEEFELINSGEFFKFFKGIHVLNAKTKTAWFWITAKYFRNPLNLVCFFLFYFFFTVLA